MLAGGDSKMRNVNLIKLGFISKVLNRLSDFSQMSGLLRPLVIEMRIASTSVSQKCLFKIHF